MREKRQRKTATPKETPTKAKKQLISEEFVEPTSSSSSASDYSSGEEQDNSINADKRSKQRHDFENPPIISQGPGGQIQ